MVDPLGYAHNRSHQQSRVQQNPIIKFMRPPLIREKSISRKLGQKMQGNHKPIGLQKTFDPLRLPVGRGPRRAHELS
ncbi:hypothetical protein D3C73_629260 [compost metagenome]